jgi:hypothetical protein
MPWAGVDNGRDVGRVLAHLIGKQFQFKDFLEKEFYYTA